MSQFLPWKILHVPLQKPLPALDREPAHGGVFIVFWNADLPLGQLLIPAAMLPIGSSQLAATVAPLIARSVASRTSAHAPLRYDQSGRLRRPLPDLATVLGLRQPLASTSQAAVQARCDLTTPTVTVAVCTRNRPEVLKKCLLSLRRLSPQPEQILVVDNDPSTGATQKVTAEFPEIRYLPEPRTGLSAARNTAVRNSEGEIIAFTDDDVSVDPGWVGAIRRIFQDPGIFAATGLVLPSELETEAQFAFQTDSLSWDLGYDVLDFDREFFREASAEGVPVWRVGAGANMAFRREVFERVGLFDERLGAGAAGCSEDSELWYRLLAEGYRCRYDPSAVVFHVHRSDWQGLRHQAYSYMRGHVAALLFQYDRYGHRGNIYRAFVKLPAYFRRLAVASGKRSIRRFLVGPGTEPSSPPLGPQIRGFFAGYAYYLRHRNLPSDPANAKSTHVRGASRSQESR